MTVIWSKNVDDTTYEVRTAGRSIRLYNNGVFHSQYNPIKPFCGQLWDLLALPALFKEHDSIHRVLVLGVGGGAVIKQLQALQNNLDITGIDIDADHLYIATKFFGVTEPVKLVCSDADVWLHNYQGLPFDLIIDDLFCENDGQPERAIAADHRWMSLLHQHLAQDGILVGNFVSRQEFRNCANLQEADLWHLYPAIFQLSCSITENRVGIFLKQTADPQHWRQRIQSHPSINTRLLRYTLRRVK